MSVIPKTQTVALVRKLGGPIEFDNNYPVPVPGPDEVLAKVLYTGVCQSDLHTAHGTATGADGHPITNIKLPHIGGHEGIGRIMSLGRNLSTSPSLKIGRLVGIRFQSRICHRCEFCLSAREQYCQNATNHLHHEDGSFQEYITLDTKNLVILPEDVEEVKEFLGPVLCAGVTSYKAVLNATLKPGESIAIIGAGGGLGTFAVSLSLTLGYQVLAIDTGTAKREYLTSLGAQFLDFRSDDVVSQVQARGGVHAVLVCAGNSSAFSSAVDLLRVNGTLCLCGIPPGSTPLDIAVAKIAIKGITIKGNLTGSMKECLEVVELVRCGKFRPRVEVRGFRELPKVYEELEKGNVVGRVVLKVAEDEDGVVGERERPRL